MNMRNNRSGSYRAILVAIGILLLLTACGSAGSRSENKSSSSNQPAADTAVPSLSPEDIVTASPEISSPTSTPTAEEQDPVRQKIKEAIASMSVEQKIGQMMIVGFEGTTAGAHIKDMIANKHIGGVILYKRNISSANQTWQLLNDLKQLNNPKEVPLWLSVDQEGGTVSRMPKELQSIASPGSIGKKKQTKLAYRSGQAIGIQLKALGFNWDFAPVLDINSNPQNPVIGNRSYGSTVSDAATYGIEAMKGIQSQQIATSVKHFPGHGDTSVDSHYDLPVITKTKEELKQFEVQPFVQAIDEQADSIMIGHLLIPDIDDKYPASLSKAIITDWLRNELHYDGVVLTDDMTMGGITKKLSISEAAIQTIKAGTDILLVGHDAASQNEIWNKVKEAVNQGTISEDRLDESVERILLMKHKYELSDEPSPALDITELNEKVSELLAE